MAHALSPAATMKLVGGDPCLDFVNTVGGRAAAPAGPGSAGVRADKLGSYSDLVAFGVHTGLVDAPTARALLRRGERRPGEASAALDRALVFREALYRTLLARKAGRAPVPGDLAALNAEMAASRDGEVLAARPDGLRWEWRQAAETLESPLWTVARAAAALLVSPELDRLRQCGGRDCGWLFLDRSRNHSRQWCRMEDCGNLAKVRRFRRRHARSRGRARPRA